MRFSIDVSDGVLVVRVSGAPSVDEAKSMIVEMRKRSEESALDHALIELRVAFGLDLVETMALVQKLGEVGFPNSFKFAVLLLDNAAREGAEFAELAGSNRGRAIKVFSDRAAALAWLAPADQGVARIQR